MLTDSFPAGISAVRMGLSANDRCDALAQVARVLIQLGAVRPAYLPAMRQREQRASTYVGGGIAIPHGGTDSASTLRRSALVVLKFQTGIDWGAHDVHTCIGIATVGPAQLGVLRAIAGIVMDPVRAAEFRNTSDIAVVLHMLQPKAAGWDGRCPRLGGY